jgi:hypothetical protein
MAGEHPPAVAPPSIQEAESHAFATDAAVTAALARPRLVFIPKRLPSSVRGLARIATRNR